MSIEDLRPSQSVAEGNSAINPSTGRPANATQGILLLAGSCMPALGTVLVSPILPTVSKEFASTPGVSVLVPLLVTIPALMAAVVSPFAGNLVDRLGRRPLLIISLILYALVGTAPLYLPSLTAILISRAAIGLAEIVVVVTCTTLIADYFRGERRRRYFSAQQVVTSLAAAALFFIAGVAGQSGWRTVFWLYSVAVLLAIASIFLIWQPGGTRLVGDPARAKLKLPSIPWKHVRLPLIVTIFGGVVFSALIVELPFVLTNLGVENILQIGAATAIAALGTAAGAISIVWIGRFQPKRLIPIGLALAALGFIIVWLAASPGVAIAGATVASAGTGVLLPTLISWTLTNVGPLQRGRVSGFQIGALALGQIAAPILLLVVGNSIGGLAPAIGSLGFASIVVLAVLIPVLRRRKEMELKPELF